MPEPARLKLPRLYAIVDQQALQARGLRVRGFAEELRRAGVTMLQYRDKRDATQEVLGEAAVISDVFRGTDCLLVMNDRADLAVLAGWNAVHVGQTDLPPAAAKKVFGPQGGWVGVSTHTDEQVQAAGLGCADYVAVGPVFSTASKADAEPAIGLEGVRKARALTTKPLVAIGGITRENAMGIIKAGADCVAVIGALLMPDERPGKVAEEFLRILR